MEHRVHDDPRAHGPADGTLPPDDLPVPRTDPAAPGLGDGIEDSPRRTARPPADQAALDDARADPLDPPEDRGRYDPDLDRVNRGIDGGRAGGTGP